ncbi:MAG: outer membrane protein transport protein [Campylobacter sp.]|nr:outer membrane protein transport protein [Campylobacter sp.]
MIKKLGASLFLACNLFGAGYAIHEQSTDALALLSTNIATSFGPDAAYYNPANMVDLDATKHYFENTLVWFHIDPIKFNGDNGVSYKSNPFNTAASTMHYVSPAFLDDNLRFGFSLTVPAAVGISWNDYDPTFSTKHFKFKVIELNPTLAYQISDSFSVGAGIRAVYIKGKVSNELYGAGERVIKGDSLDFGYNLAATYRATENLRFAATYRSKVDMTLKGTADVETNNPMVAQYLGYNGDVKTTIPLPASLTLGASYKFNNTTFMLAYDRTWWSDFNGWDFDYANPKPNPLFKALFDDPVVRNYRDTNAYRIGVAHNINNKWRLMGSFAYDQSAAKNDKSRGFELPDTKTYAYSAGANYKFNENFELTFSGFYQDRRAVRAEVPMLASKNVLVPTLYYQPGEYENARIWILAMGLKCRF